MKLVFVFLGGGAGCVLRFLISAGLANVTGLQFPLGTAIVNISGSFLIGLLAMTMQNHHQFQALLHPLFIAGFLGGFTTFSSFSGDTLNLYKQFGAPAAIINLTVNVVFSLTAVWLGSLAAKYFLR
ncbi:MAG: fluoride efflux transporter CrcB [Bacteroidia bacterium]